MSDICTVKKSTLDGIARQTQRLTGSTEQMKAGEIAGKLEDVPSQPAKGLAFSEYDSDGYPHKAEFVGFTAIPPYAFANVHRSSSQTIPAFSNLTVYIPSSVKIVGDHAFFYTGLFFSLAEGIETIDMMAFEENRFQTNIEIPSSVTLLGQRAFNTNTALTTVTFKGSVPNLLGGVFKYSTAITLYDFSNHTGTIPTLYDVASLGHANGCVIKVPSALLTDWQSATNWSALTDVTWQGV